MIKYTYQGALLALVICGPLGLLLGVPSNDLICFILFMVPFMIVACWVMSSIKQFFDKVWPDQRSETPTSTKEPSQ